MTGLKGRGTPAPCAGVYIIRVLPRNCDSLVQAAIETANHSLNTLPGFIEARVLASEDKTNVIVYAAWETREDWSRSRWDAAIQEVQTAFHELAETVEFKFYMRREVI